MTSNKIVITGADGFVGTHLVKYLNKKAGYKLYLFKRSPNNNLRDSDSLNKFKGVTGDVDTVIHLAASPNTHDFTDINMAFENNYSSTKNVIKTYYNANHIFMSSIMVYGGVYNKDNVKNPRPNSIYAASKIACENLYEVAHQQYDTKCLIVRAGTLVGPNMTHGLVQDIEKKVKGKGGILELYGRSPGVRKSYTHITDFCRFIDFQLNNHDFNKYGVKEVNFCNSGAISVKEVAEIIMDDLGKTKEIMFNEHKGSKTVTNHISVQGDKHEGFTLTLDSKEVIRKRNVVKITAGK